MPIILVLKYTIIIISLLLVSNQICFISLNYPIKEQHKTKCCNLITKMFKIKPKFISNNNLFKRINGDTK